uniref:Uncharacterized protein n=1 Tax=Romanomermis culicivorax TaxID=13658 RepID=A0A915JQ70_ROMCU
FVRDSTNQSTIGSFTHYQTNPLVSATPHITSHIDQLASATPHIINPTPQVKTHRKTTGPLTTRHHLYLDV